MDHVARPTLTDGGFERVDNKLSPQVIGHRPADDLAAPGIKNDGEIEEPARRRHEGDVGNPQLVGPGRGEVPVHQVRCRSRIPVACVVVIPLRRRLAPTSPAARISRAIRLRPCLSPLARSSACTRGAPYVSRELAWIVRTRFSSAASATACAEAGRRRQA